MKRNGFIDIDFGALFLAIFIIGGLAGFVAYPFIQWVWTFLKQMIHEMTK